MTRTTVWRGVAIVMILIALLNLAAQFAVYVPGDETAVTPYDETRNEAVEPARDALIEDVGGLTSTTGLAVTVISMIFFVVAGGLLLGKPWGLPAQLALGTDITFKALNIISQLTIGDTLLDVLPAIFLIVIESALIYVLFRYRVTEAVSFNTKRGTPQTQVTE